MNGKVIVVTGALGALGRVVVEEAQIRRARIAGVDHAPTQVPATADHIELPRQEEQHPAFYGPSGLADHYAPPCPVSP